MTSGELAALLVAAATLVSSVAALVVAIRTGIKTDSTHDLVNGQSKHVEDLAHAAGVSQGRAEVGLPVQKDR